MSAQFDFDISAPEPPAGLSDPLKALWWLKKDGLKVGPGWEKAHGICQSAEGDAPYDWVHALCHLIEGDQSNAAYWFRMAGKPVESNAESVWQKIVSSL